MRRCSHTLRLHPGGRGDSIRRGGTVVPFVRIRSTLRGVQRSRCPRRWPYRPSHPRCAVRYRGRCRGYASTRSPPSGQLELVPWSSISWRVQDRGRVVVEAVSISRSTAQTVTLEPVFSRSVTDGWDELYPLSPERGPARDRIPFGLEESRTHHHLAEATGPEPSGAVRVLIRPRDSLRQRPEPVVQIATVEVFGSVLKRSGPEPGTQRRQGFNAAGPDVPTGDRTIGCDPSCGPRPRQLTGSDLEELALARYARQKTAQRSPPHPRREVMVISRPVTFKACRVRTTVGSVSGLHFERGARRRARGTVGTRARHRPPGRMTSNCRRSDN